MGGLPLFLIFFLIVVFVALLFFGNRLIKQNITRATQHLDDISQDYVKKQQEAQKKLEEADRVYQETVSRAKEEALALRQDILKGANEEKERIIEKARNQAEDAIQQGEKTRHLLISELEKRIETESIKKASSLLGEVIPKELRLMIHASLVKDMLTAGLPSVKDLDIPQEIDRVKVVSAFTLGEQDKKTLAKILKEKTGRNLGITEEMDESLAAGFMIVAGNLVVDGSLRFKIHQRAKELISREDEK
jgi:F0F1-type ATP synthase delta subunit